MTPSTFTFAPGLNLRVIDKDGEPWFVATDACKALGMDLRSGTYRWTVGLDASEKLTHRNSAGGTGVAPVFTLISESGLYALIMRSRKPEAQRFRKWVTSEVLPAIRIRATVRYTAPSCSGCQRQHSQCRQWSPSRTRCRPRACQSGPAPGCCEFATAAWGFVRAEEARLGYTDPVGLWTSLPT